MKVSESTRSVLMQKVPKNVIKQREIGGKNPDGSKKMGDYVGGEWVIDVLNHAFGMNWDWDIKRAWIEESQPFFRKDYPNKKAPDEVAEIYNGERGMWVPQPPIANICGTLTIKYIDDNGIERSASKTDYGSKIVSGTTNEQQHIFKSANTDALKRAARLFGVALELYRNEDEEAYVDSLYYESPWNDDMLETYADQLAFIEEFKTYFEDGEAGLAQYINIFSKSASDNFWRFITPKNIDAFVAYLHEVLETS